MALIVLEGVDGTGKSTLAEAIADRLDGSAILHCGPLDRHPLDEYALRFEPYEPGSGQHIVCDRLHWGELVYGPLYRGGSRMTEPMFRWIELYLRARGGVAFHVTQDLDVIENRLRIRGEDFLQSHHVEQAWSSFKEIADRSLLRVGDVEPGKDSADHLANRIASAARFYEGQAAQIFSRWPGYVGHHTPTALLVGDVRGGKPPHPTMSAFLPRAGNSGAFLMGALGPKWWRGAGLINAYDTPIEFAELIDALGEPPVIALGANAHKALDSQGIEHGAVPHPQYIRRFFNRDQTAYGDAIARITDTGEQRLTWQN